ncbi:hypothetical protein [Pseudomonas sp. NPDC089406]|uniref:hypothetical protein n=1 Tax=Pseudomonas sp. NPDC089406 TaxID=3364463 RepID=UPI00384CDB4F
MRSRILAGSSRRIWLAASLLGNAVLLGNLSWGPTTSPISTRVPLRIEAPVDDGNNYVLPPGTSLYPDKAFAEGHQRYILYLYHKGVIAHEDVPMQAQYAGRLINPLWLSDIDTQNAGKPVPRKEDVLAALRANTLSRDELADILRSQP